MAVLYSRYLCVIMLCLCYNCVMLVVVCHFSVTPRHMRVTVLFCVVLSCYDSGNVFVPLFYYCVIIVFRWW